MCETAQRKNDRPSMLTFVYSTVKHSQRCPRWATKFSHHCQLQLFPPSGRADLITTFITWIISRKDLAHLYFIVITDTQVN